MALSEINTRREGADQIGGAAVLIPSWIHGLIETRPQGFVHHLLEGLAAVECLLAQLAQQAIVDGERGAHDIQMPPRSHHGISFGASA